MRMSDHGLELLKEWEGDILHVYKDQAGLPTIGVGHLLTRSELTSGKIMISGEAVKWANGITEAQSLALLAQDVLPAENAIHLGVKPPLAQHQYDALVSFIFNVGAGAFHESTLRTVINNEDWEQVPEQMIRWHHINGQDSNALLFRRQREIRLWQGVK